MLYPSLKSLNRWNGTSHSLELLFHFRFGQPGSGIKLYRKMIFPFLFIPPYQTLPKCIGKTTYIMLIGKDCAPLGTEFYNKEGL